MTISSGKLEIDASIDRQEVMNLLTFIKENITTIKEIVTINRETLTTSMLIELLASVKKSYPDIKIDIFEQEIQLGKLGVVNWVESYG